MDVSQCLKTPTSAKRQALFNLKNALVKLNKKRRRYQVEHEGYPESHLAEDDQLQDHVFGITQPEEGELQKELEATPVSSRAKEETEDEDPSWDFAAAVAEQKK